jgi:hypothetical protein
LAAGVLLASLLPLARATAETRGFVVSWFTVAMYSQDGDCPDGLNPNLQQIYHKILVEAGKSPAEIETLMQHVSDLGPTGVEFHDIVTYRGRIDGKPVNAYAYPDSVPDPMIHLVQSHYGLGFNLDGKGDQSPNGFEHPVTHEKGINNQLFRALGCTGVNRAKPPERPTQGGVSQWSDTRAQMPAWLISITGDDLSKDGPVTVTFDRALKHATIDARGETMGGMTFRVDPTPRWHNVFHGTLKDGVVTTDAPGNFRMGADPYFTSEFDFSQVHLRLELKPDGALDGILGGYQKWEPIYWGYADVGVYIEDVTGMDYVGLYHALKKLADSDPDPKTGRNTRISAAYRVEAVPAFVVPVVASQTAAADGVTQTAAK